MRSLLVLAALLAGAEVPPAFAESGAVGNVAPDIVGGRLDSPTDRYGHHVLGGRGEHSGMTVFVAVFRFDRESRTGMARPERVSLPRDRVFEDVEVRAEDVTGDGQAEIVIVESSVTEGAQLAVYGLDADGAVVKVAATPHIGRRNRWLAVAGIADFDGDGRNDIAYVETPHIGGILKIWTLRDGSLVQIAQAPGVSNHRIGEDFISGGVRDCGDGPELVLATADWRRLVRARMVDGALRTEPIAHTAGSDDLARAMNCEL